MSSPLPKRFGDYEILEEVAHGGMGIVYRARHPAMDRELALKVLISDQASIEDVQRFFIEARAISRLRHPGIVPVHEVGEWRDRPYFTMDFIEGRPLNKLIDAGEITPRRAARIARDLARALHVAHAAGIVHRDVKPQNVLVTPAGEPVLTDFGLALIADRKTRITAEGQALGTPAYMSPEQAQGKADGVDARSDIYSLGAVLYEMLTFEAPFEAPGPMELIKKVLFDEPEPPRRLNPGVPADLEVIALKCLAKRPADRYETAADLAEDLDRFLGDREIEARPPSAFERSLRWLRKHPAVTLPAGTLLLVALTAGGWAWLRYEAGNREIDATVQAAWGRVTATTRIEPPPTYESMRESFLEDIAVLDRALALRPGHPGAIGGKLLALSLLGNAALADERPDLARLFFELAANLAAEGSPEAEAVAGGLKLADHLASELDKRGEERHKNNRILAEGIWRKLKLRAWDHEKHLEFSVLLATNSDERSVAYLAGKLEDPEAGVRTVAALALGWLKDRRAADPLVVHLLDPEEDLKVRVAAGEALSWIGGEKAVWALRKVVAESPDVLATRLSEALRRVEKSESPEQIRRESPTGPDALLARALALEGEDQLLAALGKLDELVYANRNAEALRARARVRMRLARWRDALVDLHDALGLDGEDPELRAQRASAFLALGETANALAEADQALKSDPLNVDAWRLRGEALLADRRPVQATESYEKALALGAGREARLGLARARLAAGDVEHAIAGIRSAIDEQDGPEVRQLLAEAFAAAGRNDEASAELDRAIAAGPKDASPWVARARLQLAGKDLPGAMDSIRAAIQAFPGSPEPYLLRGDLFRRHGDPGRAIRDFTSALQVRPDDPEALALRALCHHELSDDAAAEDDARKALHHAPRDPRAQHALGAALLGHGRHEEASQALERAAAGTPESSPDGALVRCSLGEALVALGRRDEADAAFSAALAADPSLPQAWMGRAILKVAQFQYESAESDLNQALARRPGWVKALIARGQVRSGLKRYDLAIQDYGTAIEQLAKKLAELEQNPGARAADPAPLRSQLAEAFSKRGDAHYAAQRFSEASTDFDRACALDRRYCK